MTRVENLVEGDIVLIEKNIAGRSGRKLISFGWTKKGRIIEIIKEESTVKLENDYRTLKYKTEALKRYN